MFVYLNCDYRTQKGLSRKGNGVAGAKQTQANRRNALKSTGPKTLEAITPGRRRSRRRAEPLGLFGGNGLQPVYLLQRSRYARNPHGNGVYGL